MGIMEAVIDRKERNQGMNWIRQEKRLALYLRDGMACAYCGEGVEAGAKFSLDHVSPHSMGGTNHAENLVTCCIRCNSSRGNRKMEEFASATAAYLNHGITAEEIIQHVTVTRQRPLPKDEAKELIARRGSAARVLAGM